MFCCIYICASCVCSAGWGQKRAMNPLELGLLMVESLYVGVGNCIQVQFPANALNGWTTSPGPSPGILISCYALQFLRVWDTNMIHLSPQVFICWTFPLYVDLLKLRFQVNSGHVTTPHPTLHSWKWAFRWLLSFFLNLWGFFSLLLAQGNTDLMLIYFFFSSTFCCSLERSSIFWTLWLSCDLKNERLSWFFLIKNPYILE